MVMFLPYGDRFLPLGTKPAHAACYRILGGYPPVEVFLPYGVRFCPLAQTKPAGCCPVLPSRSTSARGGVSHYGKRFRSCLEFILEGTER